MSTKEFLTALLRDWHGTLQHPDAARVVMFAPSKFPGFYGHIIREIHLHDGNWKLAVRDILSHRGTCPALPRAQVLAFKKWAEKITARPVRGLLTWPDTQREET